MRVRNFLLYSAVLISFLLSAALLAARFLEPNPLRYENNPFDLPQRVYHPGDDVTFDVVRCAMRETNYSFSSMLVNADTGFRSQLPGATAVAIQGCETVSSTPKTLPDTLEPGKYYFEFVVESQGLFRSFTQTPRTQNFLVKPVPDRQ